MKLISRWMGVAVLATTCVASHAAVVFSTPSLSGYVDVRGFSGDNTKNDTDANVQTFTATYSNLVGGIQLLALPDGNYTVSVQGAGSFTGCALPQCTISGSIATPVPVFSGYLSSSGLTPGNYAFNFGTPIGADIDFGFTINYDGATTPQVMGALGMMFGLPFSDPTGAGSLTVDGTFLADGTGFVVDFTESNLNWTGYGALLRAGDNLAGGGDGAINGAFQMSNVQVTAVPEPATLALVGLSLLGLAATRRRA